MSAEVRFRAAVMEVRVALALASSVRRLTSSLEGEQERDRQLPARRRRPRSTHGEEGPFVKGLELSSFCRSCAFFSSVLILLHSRVSRSLMLLRGGISAGPPSLSCTGGVAHLLRSVSALSARDSAITSFFSAC